MLVLQIAVHALEALAAPEAAEVGTALPPFLFACVLDRRPGRCPGNRGGHWAIASLGVLVAQGFGRHRPLQPRGLDGTRIHPQRPGLLSPLLQTKEPQLDADALLGGLRDGATRQACHHGLAQPA